MIESSRFSSHTLVHQKRFHSDCGGEFANDVFQEMTEKFGIETSTTPGESPFSNDKVERGNAMLYETMMKTMEDVNCNMETALMWAVSAKKHFTKYIWIQFKSAGIWVKLHSTLC